MSALILDGNWKQHPVYTKYFFCDDGRVVSFCKKNPRQIHGTTAGQQGYKAIPVDGSKKIYIHRAVCELFNGPPKQKQVCRHLDGNKYNNAASNLSWGSYYDNCQDMILHGNALVGEKNPMAKLTEEQVKTIRSIREDLKVPYHQIAKMYGISTMTAFRAATKRSWK